MNTYLAQENGLKHSLYVRTAPPPKKREKEKVKHFKKADSTIGAFPNSYKYQHKANLLGCLSTA